MVDTADQKLTLQQEENRYSALMIAARGKGKKDNEKKLEEFREYARTHPHLFDGFGYLHKSTLNTLVSLCTNEVNFAILHLFGYKFAPRYKDLQEEDRTALNGFRHPSQYGDMLLKPIRKINEQMIVEDWENIQRIMVSLAMKITTQSIIVGKLSAYARKNKTRRALWEYDNIIRSLYLLKYIDSLPLRRNVQRALTRIENYHQLRRAVSYANALDCDRWSNVDSSAIIDLSPINAPNSCEYVFCPHHCGCVS